MCFHFAVPSICNEFGERYSGGRGGGGGGGGFAMRTRGGREITVYV